MLSRYKNSIVFVLLIVMFLFKFVSVQTYSHTNFHSTDRTYAEQLACDHESSEEDEECESCNDIFEATFTPFNSVITPVVHSITVLFVKEESQKLTKQLFLKDFFVSDLSNRPPPTFS